MSRESAARVKLPASTTRAKARIANSWFMLSAQIIHTGE
jgi:hypothetical protein